MAHKIAVTAGYPALMKEKASRTGHGIKQKPHRLDGHGE
jgi:hypothetical protein